jgi:tRNA(Leu) C34 or U34 (ribose-2'-O)-methylase TrmL
MQSMVNLNETYEYGDLIQVKKDGELFTKEDSPSIILYNPKYAHNLGAAVRGCSCFGAKAVIFTGNRIILQNGNGKYRLPREERMKDYKDILMIHDEYPLNRFPKEVTPVAVEVRDNSESLFDFHHPENAVYVFGPEDSSIPQSFLRLCHRFVKIPTEHCLNLAVAVNIILYDRKMKESLNG